MKKFILISLLAVCCFACKNKAPKEIDQETVQEPTSADLELLGFWVGNFVAKDFKEGSDFVETNRLNIAIKSILGDKVLAQSVVAGNKRPLKGKIIRKDGSVKFILTEPGDNKYDGRFDFELINDTLVGSWEAFNSTLPVTKRTFKLVRKEFTYNPAAMLPADRDYFDQYSETRKQVTDTIDGEAETYTDSFYRAASESVYQINSSTHLFTENELKNLKKLDLEILRNTIFARHGYTFKKKSYRQFFDYVEWYVPVTDNIDGQLTAIEKGNIKLLQRFEKYAEDNYDTYGR